MTDVFQPDRRPAVFDLWACYRFHSSTLALMAGVEEKTVQAMLCYQSVQKSEAQKVLVSLSILLHKEYTLLTVYVPLIETGETDEAAK